MGWETRGGRKYFYVSTKRDGRHVKKYVGRGSIARALAQRIEQDRQRTKARRAAIKKMRASVEEAEALNQPFEQSLELLIGRHLNASGFHYWRGSWRKRRRSQSMASDSERTDAHASSLEVESREDGLPIADAVASLGLKSTVSDSDSSKSTGSEVDSLLIEAAESALAKSDRGPVTDAAAIHRQQLTKRFGPGSLFATVLQRYAILFTRRDRQKLRDVFKQAATEFRTLCPVGVSEIEIVAAERVAIARMKVQVFDLLSLNEESWLDSEQFIEKRQERASRELERAMKAFLAMRKAASSVPGFRMTVSERLETSVTGDSSQIRSVTVESVPEPTDSGSE